MTTQQLTPAQMYAQRIINAVDELVASDYSDDWAAEVQMLVMERPQTLRNALNAYLYKSLSQQRGRKSNIFIHSY